MNAQGQARPQPSAPPVTLPTPPGLNDLSRRPSPPGIGALLSTLALILGSIAVMAPWPLLGTLAMRSSFEEPTEAFYFFGGVTLFPLVFLALFASVSEEVYIALVMLVWLAAAVLPVLWLRRRLRSWLAIGLLLGAQSAFSLVQAAMGAMLIIGKSI